MDFKYNLLTEVLNKLLDEGIKVSLFKTEGMIKYDLNLQAKSGLYIYATKDDSIEVEGRSDYQKDIIHSYEELLDTAVHHMCGQNYVNLEWQQLLLKEGKLRIKTTTEIIRN